MWTKYRVQWDFLTRMYGSVPSDPEVIAAWLKARMPTIKPAEARPMEAIQEEVLASIERGEVFDEKECQILVFQRHGGLCCVRFDTIRAHIKDCARVLSNQVMPRREGERAFSTRVINGVYTDPAQPWIPILRPDGSPTITKPDGEVDKFVHPRSGVSALKRLEWLEPARLDFTLFVLTTMGDKPSVAESDLHHIFTYGGVHGYGGERSADGGKYTYRIERLEGERPGAPQSGGDLSKAGTDLRRRPARRARA